MKILASFLFIVTIVCGCFTYAADSITLKDIAGDYYFGDGLGVNCSLTGGVGAQPYHIFVRAKLRTIWISNHESPDLQCAHGRVSFIVTPFLF